MILTTRQKELWQKILKFDATAEHLSVWERQIKTAIGYQKALDGLTMEKLMPLWKAVRQQKADPAPAGKSDPVLKNTWREIMDFAATAAHIAALEKYLDKETDIDGYFQKVTVEDLLEVIREVAQGPKPTVPTTPQPNLQLAEAK